MSSKEENIVDIFSDEDLDENKGLSVEGTSKAKKGKNRKKEKKKKVKKENKKWDKPYSRFNTFKALNEKIVGMGYSYSLTSFMKNFLGFSGLIILMGYFHKMHYAYILVMILFYSLLLPFSIYSQYKYLYEQKRFQELCVYLKQMKINFKSSKKILISLQETLENFEPSDRIYPYMVEAINDIKKGHNYREALNKIEQPFKNSYITKLHAYMILGEMEGGASVFQALDNIDYESWRADTYLFQTQKFKYQNQNGYFSLLGLGITLCVVLIFQNLINESGDTLINVFETHSYQMVTFFYILGDMVSYTLIKTMITGKWIREDE